MATRPWQSFCPLARRPRPPVALFLLSLTLAAQTPRQDAEQALRGRVNEFFQLFVDGQFRKALDLVAEDTKDEYFASGKMEIKSFQIDKVDVDDSLAKATVDLTVKRVWRIRTEQVVIDTPMPTTWKIENSKWVWYHQLEGAKWPTPMGPSDSATIERLPNGSVKLPDKLDPSAIAVAAERILQGSKVDKSSVSLASNQSSSDKVTFHNGNPGSVGLELRGIPALPGFTAKLDKTTLNAGDDAVIEIRYAPAADVDKNFVPQPANLVLAVSPFNQEFKVHVQFGAK